MLLMFFLTLATGEKHEDSDWMQTLKDENFQHKHRAEFIAHTKLACSSDRRKGSDGKGELEKSVSV